VALSIVTTLYRSAAYLEAFHGRVTAAAERIVPDFEIILVNDGSPDESLAIAQRLVQQDRRTRVVDLSRNFGQHKAMMTGLQYAQGERIFLIDCDLEVAPEYLADFTQRLQDTAADAVYGVQETRRDAWPRRIAGAAFYGVFNRLSVVPIPRNLTTTRLMTRRYVRALLEHREREIMIGGLFMLTGFLQVPLTLEKGWKGSSTYSVARRATLLVDSITSFSEKPLVMIFYLGVAIFLISLLGAIYLIIRWIFFGGFLIGWASVFISIWLLGGLFMLSLGIIGFYLARIFVETKQRPYTIVRDVYESDEIVRKQLQGVVGDTRH
jgi:putative glycosyltransferase